MIVEGRLVDAHFGPRWGQVQIVDGHITRIGDLGLKPDLKLGENQLVFPGFVDVHTHLRQGDEYKEDFHTASAAALNGGVTSLLDMPNNPIPPVTKAMLAGKEAAVAELPVDIGFYVGLGPDTRPSGHRHYKAFMGPSIGNLFFHGDEDLEETVRHYRDCRITLHCEDPEMLRQLADQPSHEQTRPEEAERLAVTTALRLARKHGFRVHVAHLSQTDSLPELEAAAQEFWPDDAGLPGVVWEATPHHLFFDWDNRQVAQRNTFLKMNPPLRSSASRAKLLEAFLAGRIHFLSTDHAPHTIEEKSTKNPSGVPLLDTYGAFGSWLMQQGLSARALARHACYLPGLFTGRKVGRLLPGYRGHLAVLDWDQPWTVRAEDCRTKCAWSPFEGVTFPARVSHTVASGRLFQKGQEVT
ncbi:MAG: amidohydrolase family protein [Candidatus Eremiobacteraeota bacterium]|nr:amidohydrolase family protein [Candidatus Eremiobacteraeota bacterium]